MNFLELTKKRFSVRNYKSDRVEQDKIDYIIECARLAPSAVNYQPWHFMVVVSEEQKQNLRQCYNREWFARAPVYIVVCADKSIAWVYCIFPQCFCKWRNKCCCLSCKKGAGPVQYG